MLTAGSVCSGYGGLDLAIERFFGAETRWFVENDAAPSAVLAARWPGIPNHGDLTAVDWGTVAPVDIIAGGTPCQDLSTAGRRAGMQGGTRSNLWVAMREAIAVLRPRVVIWENVRGAYSAYASSASDVENVHTRGTGSDDDAAVRTLGFDPGLLGIPYGPDRPALRALGRVLGDLADLGFDAEWIGLRAADAGAPHNRHRVFVVAYAADADGRGFGGVRGEFPVGRDADRRRREDGSRPDPEPAASADAERVGRAGRVDAARARAESTGRRRGDAADADDTGRGEHGRAVTAGSEVDPAEHARHVAADAVGGEPERWGRPGRVAGTPGSARGRVGSDAGGNPAHDRRATDWGVYAAAVRRWESVLGRPAPSPTNPDGKQGQHRLAPPFVEWMMGAPAGHVTGPDLTLTRNAQLRMLGNGVVTQQAELALQIGWDRLADVRKADAQWI